MHQVEITGSGTRRIQARVSHTRPNARLKEGGLRRSKHEFHFRASARLVDLRVAGGLGVNTEITKMFLYTRPHEQLGSDANQRRLRLILTPVQPLVAHLDQDILLHPVNAKAHAAGHTVNATL